MNNGHFTRISTHWQKQDGHKYSTHGEWRTLGESLRKLLKHNIYAMIIQNVANAQTGILTTHSGQQLAQNSLVDLLLECSSQTIFGGFPDHPPYKFARQPSGYRLSPGFHC